MAEQQLSPALPDQLERGQPRSHSIAEQPLPQGDQVIQSACRQRLYGAWPGVAEGDVVVIESRYGSTRGVAHLTQRIHPEVVGMQHGFGHTGLGHIAKGRGTAAGGLSPIAYDPLAGQAVHKEICVRVRRA